MTCSQCRFEFCWLCLGPWADHGERTGGFYNCNTYKRAKEKGEIDEAEQQRQHARASLERYMHYWQRWAENDKARKTALKQLKKFTEDKMEALSERTHTPTSQLKFITDAWWTAAASSSGPTLSATTRLQRRGAPPLAARRRAARGRDKARASGRGEGGGRAARRRCRAPPTPAAPPTPPAQVGASSLAGLSKAEREKVEKDLLAFLRDPADGEPGGAGAGPGTAAGPGSGVPPEWQKFRTDLIGLTDVTRAHFEKLVNEFEKGLEVALGAYTTADADVAGPSGSGPPGGGSDEAGPPRRRTRASKRSRGGAAGKAPAEEGDEGELDEEMETLAGFWMCGACTFCNTDLQSQACEMDKAMEKKVAAAVLTDKPAPPVATPTKQGPAVLSFHDGLVTMRTLTDGHVVLRGAALRNIKPMLEHILHFARLRTLERTHAWRSEWALDAAEAAFLQAVIAHRRQALRRGDYDDLRPIPIGDAEGDEAHARFRAWATEPDAEEEERDKGEEWEEEDWEGEEEEGEEWESDEDEDEDEGEEDEDEEEGKEWEAGQQGEEWGDEEEGGDEDWDDEEWRAPKRRRVWRMWDGPYGREEWWSEEEEEEEEEGLDEDGERKEEVASKRQGQSSSNKRKRGQ
eukprot:scaffold1.g5298.t1